MSLVILTIWFTLIGASCLRIASFFGLNRIFSSASKKALLKHNNRLGIRETNQIAEKWNWNFVNFLQTAQYYIKNIFVRT